MEDITITAEDREQMENNITDINVEGKISINYNSITVGMNMTVDEELGHDKCYMFLRQQLKYRLQQAKKDLEKEYWK